MKVASRILCTTVFILTFFSAVAAKPIRHYVFFGMDRESIPQAKGFLETPAFEGAQVSYSWRQLEQGKGNYDFSLIREDLAFMNAHGKRLWILITDVAFSDLCLSPVAIRRA